MASRLFTPVCLTAVLFMQAALVVPVQASSAPAPIYNQSAGETEGAVYIIQLADDPIAVYAGGAENLAATSPRVTGRRLDVRSPEVLAYDHYLVERQRQVLTAAEQALGRSLDVRFQYRHAYNGLAVFLTPQEAGRVASLAGVVMLYREGQEQLMGDAGPAWINADRVWGGLGADRDYAGALDGAQEVPPNASSATGAGTFSFNLLTGELHWDIAHDLDLANVTAAHIHHGAFGINGPIELSLDHTVNPMVGSAVLTATQRARLANRELYVNIHTAAFPGGEIRGQIQPTGSLGEGVIVGVIDTGIHSAHPAFAEVGGDGYAHVNPYGSGNYAGYCAANPSFCNAKLIGAWALHPSSANPEDTNGHGSHVASIAVGNVLLDADLHAPTATFGFDVISGVAPHASVIAYQACVPSCPTSSTTAAVNQAIIDGVDVLNYAISGGTNPYVETTAVAFRNAVAAGIVVNAVAGNSGPGASTVIHHAPWLLTVAASTHDRAVINAVVDFAQDSGGVPAAMHGEGAAGGYGPAPLVYAGDLGNPLCDVFGGVVFGGEIVVCDRGIFGRVQKGANVLAAGGGGMILVNDPANAASLNADAHVLPASHVSYADGLVLKDWMAAAVNPVARLQGGAVDYDATHGDVMFALSARGPAGSAVPALANVLKPDLAAPGVNVLAAYHAGFSPSPELNIVSGTSMSVGHASGAAALLRALHPGWTAPEIKSALMLGAASAVRLEDAIGPGNVFAFGAGRIDLAESVRTGFVLHVADADFIAANPDDGGDPRQLNLPSMADRQCVSGCNWSRTLRSVLDEPVQYNAWITSMDGVVGTVSPSQFTIAAGGTQNMDIEVDVNGATSGAWAFAELHIAPVPGANAIAVMPIAVFAIGDLIHADRFQAH